MILHATDFHGNERWYEWLAAVSPKFSLVALTGDLLDANPLRQQKINDQMERVMAHLRKIKAPLAICSGNHDSLPDSGARLVKAQWLQELRGKNIWVDGDAFEFGAKFRCVGWQAAETPAAPDEIWLIHSPCDQTPTGIVRGGVDFGDFTFGEQCREGRGPKLALSGHIHDPQAHFARVGRTSFLNPGCAEKAPTPNHNIIDLGRGVAFHHSAFGQTHGVRLWSR